jgi:hypothetical protein
MNRMLQTIFVIGTVLTMAAGYAQASVLIDFEAYADTQNLNGVNLGGVTLTAPAGSVAVFSNNRFGASYHSAINAVSNIMLENASQDNPLIGVFDVPVTSVSLWAGDAGVDSDSWTLKAFDAVVGGNLINTMSSGIWNGDPYMQLAITSSLGNIWRFEADFTGPSPLGIAYDDLEFEVSSNVIPEPTSLIGWTLLAALGITVGWWRMRRSA